METEKKPECADHRQLDFIQRIGRIGYWEFDPQQQTLFLPQVSRELLGETIGSIPDADQPLLQALLDPERKRFQSALDVAVANGAPLQIELQLETAGGRCASLAVRGGPLEVDQGATWFAGTFQDVTVEKLRDVAHETINTQLQALLDALPQGVSVVDKDMRLILWNRQFSKILDFPQELVFQNAQFEDFIRFNAMRGDYGAGDPHTQVQAIVARAREFLPHRFERRLPTGRTLLVEGFPFRSGGEISGFVTTYTDVTDQKISEDQLTRQRDVMKTVIDNFPGGISLCDPDLRFTTYNDQFMQLLDFPPELFAKGWASFEELAYFNAMRGEYGPGDPQEQVRATVERARNFQAHRIERQRPNGRWLEIEGTPIPSGGFVTSYMDITVRKQAEEALKKSEERWNFALEGANEGVWDWNFQTGEVVYSKRWKEMFGYAEADIGNTTQEWLDRVHPDDLETVGTSIELHLYTMSKPPSIEYRFRCKDGSWKWTLGRGMVVKRNAEGKPLRLVGTNSDISERKQIEAELVHSKEVAEASREKVTSLLDNSGQGFLSFGADLVVEPAYSRACQAMLGGAPAGRDAARVLFGNDGAREELLHAVIPAVLAETDPATQEVMLSLLPAEIQREDLILKAEYRLLDGDRLMLVLTDMTAERRMAAMLESERRHLELIVMAVSDSRNFFETIDGFQEFLAQGLPRTLADGRAPQVLAKELYRQIHTYKGLLNQFSFPSAPKALHAIETRLSELSSSREVVTAQQLADLVSAQALQTALDADLAVLSGALGEDFLARGESVTLTNVQAQQLEGLAARLLRGEPIDTAIAEVRALLESLSMLRKVSIKDMLMGFEGLVQQAATRLEKEVAPIAVEDDADVQVDPQRYRPFFRSLVHVFRNAVAHGIETPEARWAAGKDEVGRITCRLARTDDALQMSIADDGAGICLDALRQRAVAAGLYCAQDIGAVPDTDITQLIFMDNISTQAQVSELAGRGVGLPAVLAETKNLGGRIVVHSVYGQGTEFMFEWPLSQNEPMDGGAP